MTFALALCLALLTLGFVLHAAASRAAINRLSGDCDRHRAEAFAARSDLEAVIAEREASGYEHLRNLQVVANMRGGGAIRGILVGIYDDTFVLRGPEFIGTSARPQVVGGEITVARSEVPTMQRHQEDS